MGLSYSASGVAIVLFQVMVLSFQSGQLTAIATMAPETQLCHDFNFLSCLQADNGTLCVAKPAQQWTNSQGVFSGHLMAFSIIKKWKWV